MGPRAPNILLIMSDQHRPDALGRVTPVVQSPHLDRLAREGIRFARAYCQGPVCMPARASFVSERYVRDHGAEDNSRALDPRVFPTFIQRLQDAGYHTGCIGKTHLYVQNRATGDTRAHEGVMRALGFDDLLETPGKNAAVIVGSAYNDQLRARGLLDEYRTATASRRVGGASKLGIEVKERRPAWSTDPFPFPSDVYLDTWIGRRAVEWIENYADERPFFQWIGFAGPHAPWDAPREYVERYQDMEISLGSTRRPELPRSGPLRRFLENQLSKSESDTLTDDHIRAVRRAYYANVTAIDEQIGAILDALERRGMLEDTWIVYTADHGEMLGDHGLLAKTVFYEPSVGVPLIIRPPGGMTGRVVEGIVEHLDVPATLRELAGAGPIPGSEGRSLRGHFGGEEGNGTGTAPSTRDVAHSENFGFGAFIMARAKLVVWEETLEPVQLFDLESDPDEDRNLLDDPAYAAMREQLMEVYVRPFFAAADPAP